LPGLRLFESEQRRIGALRGPCCDARVRGTGRPALDHLDVVEFKGRGVPLPAGFLVVPTFAIFLRFLDAMIIHDFHTGEAAWRGLLNRPEAKVMSTAEERKLLIELGECRARLQDAFLLPTDKEANRACEAEFQQAVRELASSENSENFQIDALRAVARRYQDVRSRLAMANVRLIAHVAKRYRDRGIPLADLVQDGFCALLLAIDRFDLANETRLATYAIWWIRQAIQRAVAAGAYPVRLNPRQLHSLARSQEKLHGYPQPVGVTGVATAETVNRLLAATRPTISLSATGSGDGMTSLSELLSGRDDHETKSDDVNERVRDLVEVLDPREQVVVKLRYGLSGEPRRTLVQIGRVLGVSKERVRQLQNRALTKIRRSAERDEREGATQSAAVGLRRRPPSVARG
jgi:RNA polymerase primary sigma factor